MRTTVDFPDDLRATVVALARDRNQSFSRTVVELVRESISPPARPVVRTSPRTGMPVIYGLGRVITTEDVRAVDDDEADYHASFLRPAVEQAQ